MKNIAHPFIIFAIGCFNAACSRPSAEDYSPLIPAEEFTNAVRQGNTKDYSYFRANLRRNTNDGIREAKLRAQGRNIEADAISSKNGETADLKLIRSFEQEKSINDSNANLVYTADQKTESPALGQSNLPPQYMPAPPPPGSFAPYHTGQMRSNPSLWPDEAQGSQLFRDRRAFQAMDVLTIVVNENTTGKKKAETDSESKFDLTAGIANLFGIETKKWQANNTGLDPTTLISANSETTFDGKGETERTGTLRGQISAVIMEVLPNGLLRVEGTKIVSINAEEEVMVVSGLVRPIDISSDNQIDSRRIANMRIDFYGQGVLGDKQAPGWGARVFDAIWPF